MKMVFKDMPIGTRFYGYDGYDRTSLSSLWIKVANTPMNNSQSETGYLSEATLSREYELLETEEIIP